MTKFTIHGVVCQVLPVECLAEVLEDETQGDRSFQIIGNFALNGQRYVLVCPQNSIKTSVNEAVLASDLLTRRELQVAMMVCQGRVNKQIAHKLKLSEWTVSSYLRRIYTKLGVRTRTAMVAKLLSSDQGAPLTNGQQLS
jgi:DNA-binding NarL/FixJ family response regulator